jgi:hypothetical protein
MKDRITMKALKKMHKFNKANHKKLDMEPELKVKQMLIEQERRAKELERIRKKTKLNMVINTEEDE